MNFQHRHAAHCESGVMANLFSHNGATISEAQAFGLSSALGFAYLPIIKIGGLPLVAYRMPPRAIIKGLMKPFDAKLRFETFKTPQAGEARLDALLAQGKLVGLQTSVYWLPYFPEDMRFHFNAHNLLVYGKEGDEYLISDPVGEVPVRCKAEDLARARFAKGLLAPHGLLYYAERIGRSDATPDAYRNAIKKVTRTMLAPIPLFGANGIRTLAKRVAKLDPQAPQSSPYVGHIVRMQEEIGTGGGGFRFLYAAFLQEAATHAERPVLAEFAERLIDIGDRWREFALRAARMIRNREPFDPPALAALLRTQADLEEKFFRDLKAAI